MFKKIAGYQQEKNLQVATGYICNNSCIFCMESDREKRKKQVKEFTKNKIYDFLKENAKINKVSFSVGEPTLNPDLINYVRFARDVGYKNILIISNGRAYSYGNFCRDLAQSGVNGFIVSLHGHNEKIHDFLTRSPGSFRQTLEGLKNLSLLKEEFNFNLSVNYVVNKINYEFIGEFLAFLKQFSVNGVGLHVVQPKGGSMEKYFHEIMPQYKNVVQELEKLFAFKKELFFSPNKERYAVVSGLPRCCSGEIDSILSQDEIKIFRFKNQARTFSNSPFKVKHGKCKFCKYFDSCEGVFKNYVAQYGWEEFKPVK